MGKDIVHATGKPVEPRVPSPPPNENIVFDTMKPCRKWQNYIVSKTLTPHKIRISSEILIFFILRKQIDHENVYRVVEIGWMTIVL